MLLSSQLPAPVNAPAVSEEEETYDAPATQPSTSTNVVLRQAIPPYGQRRGWKPTSQEDYGAFLLILSNEHNINGALGDGGSYPECHIAQHPLGMGKNKVFQDVYVLISYIDIDGNQASSGNTLALQVDSEGNVRYDAIAQQGQRDGKKVQSQFKDLVPLFYRKDLTEEEKEMARPSEEEVAETTEKTDGGYPDTVRHPRPSPSRLHSNLVL